jgi:hypothetical protein
VVPIASASEASAGQSRGSRARARGEASHGCSRVGHAHDASSSQSAFSVRPADHGGKAWVRVPSLPLSSRKSGRASRDHDDLRGLVSIRGDVSRGCACRPRRRFARLTATPTRLRCRRGRARGTAFATSLGLVEPVESRRSRCLLLRLVAQTGLLGRRLRRRGPGGTGNAARISAFEEGHYDQDEYDRQIENEAPAS